MREGLGDQAWSSHSRLQFHGLDAEIGVFDFSCDPLPSVAGALEDLSSSNASSDEQELDSPISSGLSSPMFRDIAWSCHSFDRKVGRLSPQTALWPSRSSPVLGQCAETERAAMGLQATSLGCTPLYGEVDFDGSTPSGSFDRDDSDIHHAKRARRSRDDEMERSGSSCDDDAPTGQKRTVLNILERARREGLKSNFHKLRDTVPDLVGNKRVPKGLILKKAADYIRELSEEARTLEFTLHHLRREQERLLAWRGLDVARCGAAPFLE